MPIVYKLISPNNKLYIGYTKYNFENRFKQHICLWKKLKRTNKPYKTHSVKLFYAFDKYPPDEWSHEILFESDDAELAKQKEIYYIQYYNTIVNGYNITKGGDGRNVDKLTKEHKNSISISRKEYFKTDRGLEWKQHLHKRYAGNNNPSHKRKNEIKEQNSKWYLIIKPNNEEIIIKNLSEFCRNENISVYLLNRVANGEYKQTSGYKAFKLSDYDNVINKDEYINNIKNNYKPKIIKYWYVISPQKIIYETNNLRLFCRNHSLTPQNLGDVALKKKKSYKGWKCFMIKKYI